MTLLIYEELNQILIRSLMIFFLWQKAGIEGDLSLFDLSNKAVERIDNIEKI